MRVLQMLVVISAAASNGAPTKRLSITQPQLGELGNAFLVKERNAHLTVSLQSSGDVAYEYTGSQWYDGLRYYGRIPMDRVAPAQEAIQRLKTLAALTPPAKPQGCAAPHPTMTHAYLELWNSRRISLDSKWDCGDTRWVHLSPDAKVRGDLINALFTEVDSWILSKPPARNK